MKTASPTTTAESVELSDHAYQTASEFFNREEPAPDRDGEPFAKGIVWYDQATPIFCCLSCNEHVQALRFEGDEMADDPEQVRADAYRHLFEEAPRCDVCTGEIPEKVGR